MTFVVSNSGDRKEVNSTESLFVFRYKWYNLQNCEIRNQKFGSRSIGSVMSPVVTFYEFGSKPVTLSSTKLAIEARVL